MWEGVDGRVKGKRGATGVLERPQQRRSTVGPQIANEFKMSSIFRKFCFDFVEKVKFFFLLWR